MIFSPQDTREMGLAVLKLVGVGIAFRPLDRIIDNIKAIDK
jgi:hypothetical protein